MFGLTKREQRWKAEQEAAETLVELMAVIIKGVVEIETARAKAKQDQPNPDQPK